MRRFLRFLFVKPILRFNERYASKPDRQRVFTALTELLACIRKQDKKKGLIVPFEAGTEKYISTSMCNINRFVIFACSSIMKIKTTFRAKFFNF